MIVRDATAADLPALRAIQSATLAEPWPDLLALAVDGPPVTLVCADPDPVGYALALIGEADAEDIAGTTVDDPSGSGADHPDSGVDFGARSAYLVELAVAPAHQGQGRGSALLSALVSRLQQRGCDRLRVTAREVDDDAVTFYRDRGFSVVERLPGHFEDGDGLLLERHLDG